MLLAGARTELPVALPRLSFGSDALPGLYPESSTKLGLTAFSFALSSTMPFKFFLNCASSKFDEVYKGILGVTLDYGLEAGN